MLSKKECKVEGCCKKVVANGYCTKHNAQVARHGKTFRTRYDPNEFIFHEDCVEIKMFGNEFEGENYESRFTGSTFIDLDDYEKVKDIKWCLAADGYVFNYKVGKLHRFIYPNKNEIKGKLVDHIDRDKLNNRKSNLRAATASENALNRGLNKKGTSTNHKNVRHHANSKLYYVTIIYKEEKYCKSFSYGPNSNRTKTQALEDAIEWRNTTWIQLNPEFCFIEC